MGQQGESMESIEKSASKSAGETAAKIQWHPGFRGAFQREFRKYREYLHFEEELPLTVGSLFVDLIVIEMIQPVPMENELGKIFRKHNVCEYKGPDDALNIDDYYKTLAYACLYKCSGQTVDAIPAREITVSLIRDAYPRQLIHALEAEGHTVTERYPGVFYLEFPEDENGKTLFPTQIIVTNRLERETHSGLRVLRRPADGEDVLRFLKEVEQAKEPGDIANINAILGVSMAANAELYGKIGKEIDASMLHPALMELVKDDLEDRWKAGLAYGLEEGISGAVGIYREEMGLDDETIMGKIAARFHLTQQQAANYVHAAGN